MSKETLNASPSSASPPSEGLDLDFHAYWRTIARRRWLVIATLVVAVVGTAAITFRQTRMYESVCTIIIDLTAPRVLDKEQVQDVVDSGSGSFWYSREYYETQYKVLTSRAVLQRVADRLALATNPQFVGRSKESSSEPTTARPGVDPVDILLRNLRIDPVKESRIVRIRFQSEDPVLSANIANAIADAYIAESLSVRTVATRNASDWLEQQLADLEQKLDTSGRTLFDFKKKNDILAASWDDRQNMVTQRLTAANDALSRVRVRRAELQARNDEVQRVRDALATAPDEARAVPAIAGSQIIQQLRMRYEDARADCENLSLRYLEGHPQQKACEARVAAVKALLDKEIRTALDAARKEFDEITKTEQNLTALLSATKAEAFALNQHEWEYLELKRSYDNNQRLYEAVLRRLKDAGVTQMLQASNVRVLDRAAPNPRPVRPNIPRSLLIATLAGLIGGVALAFLKDTLDRTVTSREQVEEQIGLEFLGVVPSIEREKDGSAADLIVHTEPKGSVAECLRSVRTNLLFMSPEKPLRTILVTSSGPQEGKTTTATSLAITMATGGLRVLLIDADMRRPRLHKVFKLQNDTGLSSLIVGEGRLTSELRSTEIPNLTVLPCGPIPPNPAELLHTASFRRLMDELAGSFDRIIIDSPPVGVVSDAAVISTQVDGTLFVLKAGRTVREAARLAVRQLRDLNAKLLGAVLNDLNLADQRYGRYTYYYQYGSYEGSSGRTRGAAA